VIVSKDLFKEEWKTGIVKSAEPVVGISKDGSTDEITSYNYSIVVDGSIKSYKSQENIAVEGEPVKVKLLNNNIESVKSGAYLKASSYTIDAFDAERIKINNVVYYLQSNTVVYFVNKAGDYTLKSIADISIENQYQFITLFNESTGDNKVAAIVIKQ
jgi:hypothetical protein